MARRKPDAAAVADVEHTEISTEALDSTTPETNTPEPPEGQPEPPEGQPEPLEGQSEPPEGQPKAPEIQADGQIEDAAPESPEDQAAEASATEPPEGQALATSSSLGPAVVKTENVYVCYCSPQGLRVKIKDQDILLNGVKVSDLVTHQGGRARSGKFGVTCLPRETWNAIEAVYAKTKLFKSGRIIAVNSLEDVKAVTVERNTLRHGREQIDPTKMGVTKFSDK